MELAKRWMPGLAAAALAALAALVLALAVAPGKALADDPEPVELTVGETMVVEPPSEFDSSSSFYSVDGSGSLSPVAKFGWDGLWKFTFEAVGAGAVGVEVVYKNGNPPETVSGHSYSVTVKAKISLSAADGGTVSTDKTKAGQDETVTITATPYTGWEFDKWTDIAGTELPDSTAASATFTIAKGGGNVSATATFKKIPYKVTAESGGHGTAQANPAEATVGDTVTLTAKPDEGYEFDRWVTEPEGLKIENDKFSMPAENVTVKATFKKVYAITVEGDGQGTAKASASKAAPGETVELTATPDKGYEFDKWESSDVTVDNNSFTMPDKPVTVKATFKKKAATLTFDLAGGTLDGKTGTYTMTAKVGDTVKLPAAPTRDGYTFKCWKGSEYAAGADYKVEGDHKFTAEWEKAPAAKYAITFDANGGTGTMDKQTAEAGSTVTLTANAFKRDGYTFAGWNTAKDGSGTKYADKAKVKVEGDMTLYAQWTKNSAASKSSTAKTGDDNGTLVAALSATAVAALCLLVYSARKLNAGKHVRR